MPPLIKIKLVLNGTLNIFGIYDSGSNVSLINSKLLNLKTKKIKNAQNTQNANLKTINGVKKYCWNDNNKCKNVCYGNKH